MSERFGELMTKNGEAATEVEQAGRPGSGRSRASLAPIEPPPGCERPPSSRLGSTLVRLFLRRSDGTDSYLGPLALYRLIKFLAVGGIGVVVNLLAMALMFQVTGYRDWRASAIASTIAALHNYFLITTGLSLTAAGAVVRYSAERSCICRCRRPESRLRP